MKNVRKIYRVGDEKIVALDDITLSIEKGEICCLHGTSGSGKSTLLNLLAGLEKPTSGSIVIKGVNIEKLNEKKLVRFRQKNIGFVFQSYNLMPAYTALENVCLPLTFRGVSKRVREKAAYEIMKSVGLENRVRHKPSQMSGGQQQRVGIARAFIGNPEIVFADEPTGNLDSVTSREVMSLIVTLAKKYNQTLIIVTHDHEIAEYASRIIHIHDGRITKIDEKEAEGTLTK